MIQGFMFDVGWLFIVYAVVPTCEKNKKIYSNGVEIFFYIYNAHKGTLPQDYVGWYAVFVFENIIFITMTEK